MRRKRKQRERQKDRNEILLGLFLYVGSFFLFLEWIRPLAFIADSYDLELYLVYAGLCFLITMMQRPIISFPVKLIGLILVLDRTFVTATIGTSEWFQTVWSELSFNGSMLMGQNWQQLTPFFRTLMLLVLIWLISYLLYFWFYIMKRIFLFIVATFVFVTVMDTFTVYEANHAIIRMFVISLLMFSIASYVKRMEKADLIPSVNKWFEGIFLPSVIMLALFVFLGYHAPKADPVWPDPVPFLTSAAEQIREGSQEGERKVGYGEDDSILGGSFAQDDTPVFQAEASKRHYWRIETKNFYTGKGWTRTTNDQYHTQVDGWLDLDLFIWDDVTTLDATVEYQSDVSFDRLVYPYGTFFVDHPEAYYYSYDIDSGIVEPEFRSENSLYEAFEISYDYPDFSPDQLRNATGDDPEMVQFYYLQLPDTLPERVNDLAEQITAGEETRYDQVYAIENYFSENDFTYETTNVPIPGEHQDYVDQFLFDTQAGYCDNFSTSMIVLLRSLDIPARWVKGFTGGEVIENLSTDSEYRYLYEITNNNAHSWVEVYFPGIGWVPFEPTIGFAGEDVIGENNDDQETDDSEEPPVLEEEDQEEQEEQESQEEEVEEETGEAMIGANGSFNSSVIWVIGAILAVGLLVVGYLTRYRLLKRLLIWKFPTFKNAKQLERAYHYLLRFLAVKGMKRQRDQTLQNFALQVDKQLDSRDMHELTMLYQRVLYRNDLAVVQDQMLYDLWKKIIYQV